jgi:hypothetical protein
MKIQVDVDAMFAPEFDRLIDMDQLLLAQVQPLVRVRLGPAMIRHRKACEIEAPFLHPFEIGSEKRRVAVFSFREFFQEIEPPPAREFGVGNKFGLSAGNNRRARAKDRRRAGRGFKETSSIHNLNADELP